MSDDTYNGWKNRETWAAQLWLTNYQGVYEMVRERVAETIRDYTPSALLLAAKPDAGPLPPDYYVGEAIQYLYAELTDPGKGLLTPEQIITMISDVGSEYRIDWDEIGAAWLVDFEESGE